MPHAKTENRHIAVGGQLPPVSFQLNGFRLSSGAGMSTSRMDAPGSHWDVPGNNKEGY